MLNLLLLRILGCLVFVNNNVYGIMIKGSRERLRIVNVDHAVHFNSGWRAHLQRPSVSKRLNAYEKWYLTVRPLQQFH